LEPTLPTNQHIEVTKGRWIKLHQLVQRSIYANVLEGVPNRLVNRRIVSSAMEEGRRIGEPCHLMAPPTIAVALGNSEDRGDWTPERLPRVVCIGHFVSAPTGANLDYDWRSELTVVWFQEDYAFPLPPRVRSDFAALSWDTLARDVCFA